jgi:hypothetical protein
MESTSHKRMDEKKLPIAVVAPISTSSFYAWATQSSTESPPLWRASNWAVKIPILPITNDSNSIAFALFSTLSCLMSIYKKCAKLRLKPRYFKLLSKKRRKIKQIEFINIKISLACRSNTFSYWPKINEERQNYFRHLSETSAKKENILPS